jgi:hypothetical protein
MKKIYKYTEKASNFASPGNFALYLSIRLAVIKSVLQKKTGGLHFT